MLIPATSKPERTRENAEAASGPALDPDQRELLQRIVSRAAG